MRLWTEHTAHSWSEWRDAHHPLETRGCVSSPMSFPFFTHDWIPIQLTNKICRWCNNNCWPDLYRGMRWSILSSSGPGVLELLTWVSNTSSLVNLRWLLFPKRSWNWPSFPRNFYWRECPPQLCGMPVVPMQSMKACWAVFINGLMKTVQHVVRYTSRLRKKECSITAALTHLGHSLFEPLLSLRLFRITESRLKNIILQRAVASITPLQTMQTDNNW